MSELEASMIIHVCLHRLVVLIRFLDSAAFGFQQMVTVILSCLLKLISSIGLLNSKQYEAVQEGHATVPAQRSRPLRPTKTALGTSARGYPQTLKIYYRVYRYERCDKFFRSLPM